MNDFWQKLFKKKDVPELVQTAPLPAAQDAPVISPEPEQLLPAQLSVGCAQSIGKQRDHNEDSVFCLNTIIAGEGENLPFGIFIIADGMGGHQHGEVASRVAARTMAGYLVRKLYLPYLQVEQDAQLESLQEIMQGGVKEAQQAVVKQVPGGGTTLTAAFLLGEQLTIAHVGDSRAYFLYPDGRTQTLTRDHSLVRRLQELGQLTEKEAAVHPQRNVLYRAIGQGEPFEPDVSSYLFPGSASLLLCSDGLWGVVPDADVLQIVNSSTQPAEACQKLVEAANHAGGPDNISVIMARSLN